jgi:hypothetical protein
LPDVSVDRLTPSIRSSIFAPTPTAGHRSATASAPRSVPLPSTHRATRIRRPIATAPRLPEEEP